MITTADFGKGTRFLHEGEPYQVEDIAIQSPTARGGTTLVKVKARHLLTGRLASLQFKSGTKFDEPDIRFAKVQFLYNEGQAAVFMDQESFEQFSIDHEVLGNQAKYLTSELDIRAMYFNEQPVNVELPPYVPVKVTMVEPGTRGNTATGTVTTRAELENGVEIRVPLNIKEGDTVLVDPRDDSYHQRVQS